MHGPLEQNSQRKDDYDYSRFSLALRIDEIFIGLIINSIIYVIYYNSEAASMRTIARAFSRISSDKGLSCKMMCYTVCNRIKRSSKPR